jgi:hypothetical protein
MADFSARTPLRVLSPDEIERMLAEHRLYLETEYHQGHRANFSSADLAGRSPPWAKERILRIVRLSRLWVSTNRSREQSPPMSFAAERNETAVGKEPLMAQIRSSGIPPMLPAMAK